MSRDFVFLIRNIPAVTPAKAGVQGNRHTLATLDPGFRRDDERKRRGKTGRMKSLCENIAGRKRPI
ncbi:MAG TPA: hypothetical protein VF213_12560, partial [Dongiaceae bacterium]